MPSCTVLAWLHIHHSDWKGQCEKQISEPTQPEQFGSDLCESGIYSHAVVFHTNLLSLTSLGLIVSLGLDICSVCLCVSIHHYSSPASLSMVLSIVNASGQLDSGKGLGSLNCSPSSTMTEYSYHDHWQTHTSRCCSTLHKHLPSLTQSKKDRGLLS